MSLNGRWSTRSGACGGRGEGDIEMQGIQTFGAFELRYNGGDMQCTLAGLGCGGAWHGHTGAGWYQITFTPDGSSFSGTWGYNNDHATVGTFTGHRR